jgi:hypothetical protein
MYSDSGDGNIPLVKNREIVRKQVAFTWKNNKNERERLNRRQKRQYGTTDSTTSSDIMDSKQTTWIIQMFQKIAWITQYLQKTGSRNRKHE